MKNEKNHRLLKAALRNILFLALVYLGFVARAVGARNVLAVWMFLILLTSFNGMSFSSAKKIQEDGRYIPETLSTAIVAVYGIFFFWNGYWLWGTAWLFSASLRDYAMTRDLTGEGHDRTKTRLHSKD